MEKRLVDAARSERCTPPCPSPIPWLVYPHGKNGRDQVFYNLCEQELNNTNNGRKTYLRKSIPEMRCRRYWQSPSHQGWLVLLCNDVEEDNDKRKSEYCFLWNPLSFETIQLPNLMQWIDNQSTHYSITTCVLSCPPKSKPPDNDDCMVFVLLKREKNGGHLLVFCSPGVDKQWRQKELPSFTIGQVRSMVWFKGKLHIPCDSDKYMEIEKQLGSQSDDDDDENILSIKTLDVTGGGTKSPVAAMSNYSCTNYVESCDELFKVVRHFPNSISLEVMEMEIFRMNFSLMAWEEVTTLGDHVLFLSTCTTASCSADELGLTRGCVYYTHVDDKSFYKFDLENGTITLSLPCPNVPTPWLLPNWMTLPTTVRVTERRRTISNDVKEDTVIEVKDKNKEEQKNDNDNDNIGGELEESGMWGAFNEDILQLISSYLHPVDYLHFRAVCKANRMAMPTVNWRTTSTKTIQTASSLSPCPWLIFLRQRSDNIYNFVDPMHDNEKYFMNLSESLLHATIRFSKGGWLLMSKGKNTIFFFNPFTSAMIQVPDLPDDSRYSFSGISFSSLPTSHDCVIFAIAGWGKDRVSIFYISRGDDSWQDDIFENTSSLNSKKKSIEFRPWLNNPVFHRGVFYCLDCKGTLGVFDLKDGVSWKVLDKPQAPCNSIYQCFLVECEGKLLSVFIGYLGKWVRIFRLDFCKMVWVKVETLGKHMLFVSNTSCISAIAPNSSMENKIYFPRFKGEGIVFFSLDTGSYHSLGSQCAAQDFCNTKEKLYCSWIEPNWRSHPTVQELDWFSCHG